MMVHTVAEGATIRLRPGNWGFSEDELRRRYQWSLDDELQYWSGSIPTARSYAQFVQTIGSRDWPPDGRRISYAILTNAGNLLGMVSCYNIDRRLGGELEGEMGVYLGEKSLWGHGHGTDAIRTFLRHLFGSLEFGLVYLHTYESNLRARRSYDHIGFELDETRRRYSPRVGYHNEIRMSMTRRHFAELHGCPQPVPVA